MFRAKIGKGGIKGIVIPWLVRLYVEIMRMDYLTYKSTTMVSLFYTTYSSVDLAHLVIFRARVGKVVKVISIPWIV